MKNIFRILFVVFCLFTTTISLLAQWIQTGLTNTYVSAFAVSGTNLFAVTDGVVVLSTNNGTSWTAVDTGLTSTNRYLCLAISGTNLLAGTNGGVFLSTNNGTNWSDESGGLYVTPVLAFAVSGTNLFAGTFSDGRHVNGGVWRSNKNSISWTHLGGSLTSSAVEGLAVSGTNVFARSGGVYLSTDNGDNWNSVWPYKNLAVTSLAIFDTNLFAGTTSGIYLSTNNGTKWTLASTGLTDTYVTAFTVSSTNIFVGTYNGSVFLSTNNGTSWINVSTGLPNNRVLALAISGTNIFAGTPGGGVWRRPLSEIITSVNMLSNDLPTHFSLNQNYPNPFNPATIISFSLPSKSFVSLKIFDLIGREVATIVSEEMLAGSYSRQWNAAKMSSGIYFYRLQAGSFTETKKLVLLK